MRLFGLGATPEELAQQKRAAESLQSLQSGALPLNAIDRLKDQAARQGTPGHIFTSDLSVNELSLIDHAGFEPLGQVMGSSVYHVGWQWMPRTVWDSGELEMLTKAFYEARHLALGRLQQEAALLGATGVVGVRLEHKEYEWGSGLLEFAAIGTAIRESGKSKTDTPPFLSDLTGQDFWLLKRAGLRPVGIAIGNCTYYQVPTWRTQSATSGGLWTSSWTNQELPDFTRALYDARELAMRRMSAEAHAVNAAGIVGVHLDVKAEPREIDAGGGHRIDMIFHFTAIGTAIAGTESRIGLEVGLAMPLNEL